MGACHHIYIEVTSQIRWYLRPHNTPVITECDLWQHLTAITPFHVCLYKESGPWLNEEPGAMNTAVTGSLKSGRSLRVFAILVTTMAPL